MGKDRNEIQPIGSAALPEGKTKLDYIKNCGKLTDGSIGLIEETTSAYNETEESIVEIYYFQSSKRTTKLDMDICEGLKIDKTENFVCSWENMIETGSIGFWISICRNQIYGGKVRCRPGFLHMWECRKSNVSAF